MANFLDEDLSEDTQASNVNDLDQQEQEQQVSDIQSEEPVEQATQEDDDIPEKYRGKSAKEIARMHQEAEKALGRQGSEVGELRRLVDDFIKAQTVAKTQQQAPENDDVDDVDFFADPKTAISKAIEKHPKIKAAEELILSSKKAEALNTLKTQHPDFQEIVQSPDFAEWVGKSKVRQELFLRADQAYDFDAANELLTTFKERKAVVEKTKAIEQVERKQAVKAASMGSGKGSSESIGKKTYRRADIIDLMMRNPDRYAALSDEIMTAYAEGRVK